MRIWGKAMFRKGLAVAVILLFIGVAFASSINAFVKRDNEHHGKMIEPGKDDYIENSNC